MEVAANDAASAPAVDATSEALVEALDTATAAIIAELSPDRVLQLIVDGVRPLVSARYAALAIVGEHGLIERFVTSGIDDKDRRAIGHLPRGHGLLGLIIRERRSIRVQDVMSDPRRAGFPPHHPPMHSFLGVPIVVEGRSIGNLYLTDKRGGETFSDLDQRMVETFARHAGIAIHNARLHAQVQRLAVLQERDRIGQDLHDGIIQTLYAVGLGLEDIGELMRRDPTDAEMRVEHAIDAIHASIRDIRNFIFGLRPEALDEGDLISGLTALADEFRRGTLMEIELQLDEDIELGPDETLQVMQVTREALSNVARHADASRVWVALAADADTASLSITDNGTGFDPGASRAAGHHGLNNMRVRAESLGGSFTLESAPGSSTRVLVRWPRAAAAGHEET